MHEVFRTCHSGRSILLNLSKGIALREQPMGFSGGKARIAQIPRFSGILCHKQDPSTLRQSNWVLDPPEGLKVALSETPRSPES
jgi:hypothetical protein